MSIRGYILLISAGFALTVLNGQTLYASEGNSIEMALKQELIKRYHSTKVELTAPIRWTRNIEPSELKKITGITEGARGELRFTALDLDNAHVEGTTAFSATVPAWVSIRRIQPGEKLTREMFTLREVDVASGLAREYRGVILSPTNFKISEMLATESRQTILEGQFLASTAIQKSPVIRRGDAVTILIESEGLQLSTRGTAQEAGYLNTPVRVLTNKSKRELTGNLKMNGLVEVKL